MDNRNALYKNNPGKSGDYEFFNGFGGFVNNGEEYEILLENDVKPPFPWINVIANKKFGFHISEAGAGFTWAGNSRENKITPWFNDPVSDRASEVIYIRDEISGKVFTPVSLGRNDRGTYRVRHGFGYSVFYHEEEGINQKLTVFTPVDEPVKLWELEMGNTTKRDRYLTLTYYCEWVLGVDRDHTNPYIVTSYNNEYEYLSAKSIYSYHFRKHEAFIFSSEIIMGYTGDRQEVLGLKGSILNPLGMDKKLSCNTGACYDSCGAIQISIAIKPGETKTIIFGMGQSDNRNEIYAIRQKYRDVKKAKNELARIRNYWKDLFGAIRVKTRDRAINILVNGWLPYQIISCRLYARAAFYQCGGAYGFRDQLQDCLSLLFINPDFLKNQIIRSAGRQFEEGDVQHWWHPPTGTGVRTRITDDLLWLPYAVAAYVKFTGDHSILEEKVNYIKGPLLNENQHEAMVTPEVSDISEDIYEHCKKAILLTGFGIHGLPLIGGGDWNDGMNEVGIKGTGESVWLGWFLYTIINEFIPLCRKRGDERFSAELELMKEDLKTAIEENAWDGEWYIRAFYDDCEKLGSKENDECKIDSISQSWSIISGAAKEERALKALQSAWQYLVVEEEGVSLLLTPPFNKTNKNPGYIKRYYPGIRENGGQYTHGAVWLAIAAAMAGDKNKAYALFSMLNPILSTANKKDALKYGKEPYVMTADIWYNQYYAGRGGWSWYTGSAGWMYQGLVNWFLGIRKEGDRLVIDPAVPPGFGEYTIIYRYNTSFYTINIAAGNDTEKSERKVIINGVRTDGNGIDLVDDGKTYEIDVFL
ncbi:MAG: GH36-type glycosyl hydrolase domain-containing protein [Acetivibrionales bacterium]